MNHHNHAQAATASAGYANECAAPAVQRKTCLDAFNNELDQALKTFTLVSMRQQQIIGRIFGPSPKEDGGIGRNNPSGVLGQIGEKLQALHAISADLMAQISRLEEVA